MTKVLVPIDGSVHALHAVDIVLKQIADGRPLEVHLLNVQAQIPGRARAFLSKDVVDEYYHEEAAKALKAAREKLDQAGVPYTEDVQVGNAAEAIARYVKAKGCEVIIMGTRGHGTVQGVVLGSVATKVLHLVDVPVTLVK